MRHITRLTVVLLANMSIAVIASPPPSASATTMRQAVLSQQRLHQIALTTTDLDRAITFYRDRLGLPFLFTANQMAFFNLSGTRLMVATDKARPTLPRPTSVVYFDAPDFEATLARLHASGVKLVGEVESVQKTQAGILKLQQFEDPDGNMLAIMGIVNLQR
jgi:methylmalonyl-CoA/ethylmalonyl-CoA epimerase